MLLTCLNRPQCQSAPPLNCWVIRRLFHLPCFHPNRFAFASGSPFAEHAARALIYILPKHHDSFLSLFTPTLFSPAPNCGVRRFLCDGRVMLSPGQEYVNTVNFGAPLSLGHTFSVPSLSGRIALSPTDPRLSPLRCHGAGARSRCRVPPLSAPRESPPRARRASFRKGAALWRSHAVML